MILVRISVKNPQVTFSDIVDFIQPGGSFTPKNCSPVFNVAIMVAYRYNWYKRGCSDDFV